MSTENDQEVQKSFLEMSDEEILNVDPTSLNNPEETQEVEEATAEVIVEEAEGDANGEAQEAEVTDEQPTEEEGSVEEEEGNEESNPEPEATEPPTAAEQVEIDYKAEYERLTKPFKANGRDIQVKGVEDAITLMQMGANYNKKMAALKPNLKLLKLLENNGLLSEDKIGFLIDLEKKNPEAINKLVKDSGLDPLELDTEKADAYKPNAYTVDDREFELDAVLDEIQESPTYTRTLDIVSNKWDGQSKQVIASSPQLLKVINSHVQTGIYDLIHKEVENERTFGRLAGLSDIEAYRQVGDAIQARGGFNHLNVQETQGQQTQPKPVVVQPKPKMGNEDKLREKKRAASSTKPAVPNKSVDEDYNPLSLSDDEFVKLVNTKFL